jgi:hypothetical protein
MYILCIVSEWIQAGIGHDEMRGLARKRQQQVLKRPLHDIITRLQNIPSNTAQSDVTSTAVPHKKSRLPTRNPAFILSL